MKSIAFQDIAGGSIHMYYKEGQTRHERIQAAFADIKRTGNIKIWLINGRKSRKIMAKTNGGYYYYTGILEGNKLIK